MAYVEITDQVIKDTIKYAVCALYDVENLNEMLADNDASLNYHAEAVKRIKDYLNGWGDELIQALHKYD